MFSFSHWGMFQLTRNAHHHLMDEMGTNFRVGTGFHYWWSMWDKMKYRVREFDDLPIFCRLNSSARGGWDV